MISGHIDAIKFLLENGAIVDSQDEQFKTPLHCAAEKGFDFFFHFQLKDKKILIISLLGHVNVTKMLILNGANVNENNFHFEYSTPLHIAAEKGFFFFKLKPFFVWSKIIDWVH